MERKKNPEELLVILIEKLSNSTRFSIRQRKGKSEKEN